jgi:hypothetical protein
MPIAMAKTKNENVGKVAKVMTVPSAHLKTVSAPYPAFNLGNPAYRKSKPDTAPAVSGLRSRLNKHATGNV